VDSARRYLDCSDAVCQLIGYSRTELLEKKIDDISYHREVAKNSEVMLDR
jgi:PAS domain-containing protein